jgi:hypothetical protein
MSTVEVDGTALPSGSAHIPLVDDGVTHRVRVVLDAASQAPSPGTFALSSAR